MGYIRERLALKVQETGGVRERILQIVEGHADPFILRHGEKQLYRVLLIGGKGKLLERQHQTLLERTDGGLSLGHSLDDAKGDQPGVGLTDEQGKRLNLVDYPFMLQPPRGDHGLLTLIKQGYHQGVHVVPHIVVAVLQYAQVVQQRPVLLIVLDSLVLVGVLE